MWSVLIRETASGINLSSAYENTAFSYRLKCKLFSSSRESRIPSWQPYQKCFSKGIFSVTFSDNCGISWCLWWPELSIPMEGPLSPPKPHKQKGVSSGYSCGSYEGHRGEVTTRAIVQLVTPLLQQVVRNWSSKLLRLSDQFILGEPTRWKDLRVSLVLCVSRQNAYVF